MTTIWQGGGWRVTAAGAGMLVEQWTEHGTTKNMQARGVTHGAWMPAPPIARSIQDLAGRGINLADLDPIN